MSHGQRQASPNTADVARAVARLRAARRVLVTGFRGLGADAVVAACDLAEAVGAAVGAAVDAGDPETARPAAPTIARVGELTADRAELRDRADLVIAWFCDPDASCPGFSGDWLARGPASAGTRRGAGDGDRRGARCVRPRCCGRGSPDPAAHAAPRRRAIAR